MRTTRDDAAANGAPGTLREWQTVPVLGAVTESPTVPAWWQTLLRGADFSVGSG
jgi:hypothetical protein